MILSFFGARKHTFLVSSFKPAHVLFTSTILVHEYLHISFSSNQTSVKQNRPTSPPLSESVVTHKYHKTAIPLTLFRRYLYIYRMSRATFDSFSIPLTTSRSPLNTAMNVDLLWQLHRMLMQGFHIVRPSAH